MDTTVSAVGWGFRYAGGGPHQCRQQPDGTHRREVMLQCRIPLRIDPSSENVEQGVVLRSARDGRGRDHVEDER